ncbi:hypothetical protein L1887_31408 [Cichorium endivia]|nr:hypothetical protein L1887_31408 [Cichorium endivia]
MTITQIGLLLKEKTTSVFRPLIRSTIESRGPILTSPQPNRHSYDTKVSALALDRPAFHEKPLTEPEIALPFFCSSTFELVVIFFHNPIVTIQINWRGVLINALQNSFLRLSKP